MMLPKKQKIFAKKVLQFLNSESMIEFKNSIEEFHTVLETKIDPDYKEIDMVNEIDSFVQKLSEIENKITDYLGKNPSTSLATKLYKLQKQRENDINVLD